MGTRTGIRISGFPVEVTETDDTLTIESEGTRDLILTSGSGRVGVTSQLLEVANGTSGTPSGDAGIIIERGSSTNAAIIWDESRDEFVLGTTSATGESTGDLTVTPGNVSVERIGAGTEQAEAEVHAKRDTASGVQYSTTASVIAEDDSRPSIQLAGGANNIGLIQFGDNAAVASGQVYYDHSTNKLRIDCGGNTDRVMVDADGILRVADSVEFAGAGDWIRLDNGALTANSDSNLKLSTKETIGLNIAEAASEDAVNYVEIENADADDGPTIRSAGDDDNVDLNISPRGTGQVTFKMPHVDGMVEVRGFESGTGVLGLTADEGDDNGDSWQLVATTDGHLNIKNDISGSQVNMIDIAANATAADSTIVLTGQLQVTGGKVEGPTDSDLTIQSDGNLTFMIDNDNDETDQGFLFKNNGSATIATLYDEGMLELSSAIMAKGTYKDLLQTSSATQAVDQSRDLVGCGTTTRAITITLPAVDEASGQVLTIFDQNANANNNNITIAPNAGDDAGTKIDNSTGDYVISAAKGAVTLTSDGTHWYVISKN